MRKEIIKIVESLSDYSLFHENINSINKLYECVDTVQIIFREYFGEGLINNPEIKVFYVSIIFNLMKIDSLESAVNRALIPLIKKDIDIRDFK